MIHYVAIYLNTEMVHCTTVSPLAILMFIRNLKSGHHLILPADSTAHAQCSVPERRRCYDIADKVVVRWYSARNESWELGILKEKVGNKMLKIYMYKNSSYCIHVSYVYVVGLCVRPITKA